MSLPPQIDGTCSRKGHEPCRDRAARRLEAIRLVPGLCEHLLRHVFRVACVSNDPQGQGVHQTAVAVVELRESSLSPQAMRSSAAQSSVADRATSVVGVAMMPLPGSGRQDLALTVLRPARAIGCGPVSG